MTNETTNETTAGPAASTGQGSVTRKNTVYAAGGTVHGKGTVTRKDGTVQHFELHSKPLTQAQADKLNSEVQQCP